MSKSLFKGFGKKTKLPPPPAPAAPRVMEEITKEHTQALYRAGLAGYQIYIHTKDLEQTHRVLLELNQEAAGRNELDKNAPKTEVTEEKKSE